MMRYVILEKTPFPGYWKQAPVYRLQEAELRCFPNDGHYHKRAINLSKYPDSTLVYEVHDAEMLMKYLQSTCDVAQYQLFGVVMRED